ncbi:META domain-containing protein [Actinopolymorpha pittospori]|uniref:Heat shock protein HslJ n=1 Tax=Actinopolymorpha pittospori TaxID=648752 RepID=A0A927N4A6_9ACTN|nr:META domain-containing protein [Actinopolymorpha pittospori]MBE1612411.1 heat shock protein HslJ [Actinopolymorpha pittospori]
MGPGRFAATLTLALFALTLPGCGDRSGTTVGAAGGEPRGRTYLSTEVTEDERPRPLVPGTRIRLEFASDGRLLLSAGCSLMQGPASLDDGRIDAGQLAVTDLGCDPKRHAQDRWLADLIEAGPSWRVADDQLILSGEKARVVLLDREVADPDRRLEGTRWQPTLVEGDVASTGPHFARVQVVFTSGQVRGFSGCNRFSGPATPTGDQIEFGPIMATQRGCEGDAGRTEDAVFAVLRSGRVTATVEADRLRLDGPDGRGLVLTARPASR